MSLRLSLARIVKTPIDLIQVSAFLYLIIPFCIFLFGWYRLPVAVLVFAVIAWTFFKIWETAQRPHSSLPVKDRTAIWAVIILALWALLSGIGGYAFQNHDFHLRNAIFRDLIEQPWPLIYSKTGQEPMLLVYYIGFWLPSALIGKLMGWNWANFFLYLWTLAGLFLVVRLIANRVKAPLFRVSVFVIFFSTIDVIGTLIIRAIVPDIYPTILPPFTHLEWWAPALQFSAMTTQLFWVFNQAVPVWICVALLMNGVKSRYLIFLWSLCLFFSPLPAVGFSLFIALEVLIPALAQIPFHHQQTLKDLSVSIAKPLFVEFKKLLSIENILGGGVIALLTFFYFRANQTTGTIAPSNVEPQNLLVVLVFLILEGAFIWLLIYENHRRDLRWYAAGLFLFVSPFIRIGYGWDFNMRATIPALFFIMIWCLEFLLQPGKSLKRKIYASLLAVYLVVGALTPIYEINRSLYRSINFYLCPSIPIAFVCNPAVMTKPNNRIDIEKSFMPEYDHPGELISDDLGSLYNLDFDDPSNFLGSLQQGQFFSRIAKIPVR